MQLIASSTERTTAATDLLLALVAGGYAAQIGQLQHRNPWKARLWAAAFSALGLGAGLGAVAHGLLIEERVKARLWSGIYPSLALAVALFATGATHDRWGGQAARKMLPAAFASALIFASLVRHLPGGFLAFVVYEGFAMLFAGAVYSDLARRKALPGAASMVGGVGLSIAAAAVQASRLELKLAGMPFDHNGLFHLVQIAALPPLAAGLRASLAS